MALNIITAKFCSGSTQTWTEEAWQWDYGQVLQFDGLDLPDAYQVHFSNTPLTGETITQIGGADGVTVPDQFFTGGETIYAWVYLHEGEDDGETVYMVTIPVKKRPQPSDDVPTPVEQSAIDQAIAALNIAVEKADEAITHYPTIIDGTWHVWDVTEEEYVDTEVQAQGQDGQPGADGQDGTDGQDGQDGFSPVITVTDITGGHRVTIIDATGTQTFDVMNGQNGQPGTPGTDGTDGYSPTVTVTEITGGHRVTITDAQGAHTFDVMDGSDASVTVDDALSTTSENPVQNKVITEAVNDVKADLSQLSGNILYPIEGSEGRPAGYVDIDTGVAWESGGLDDTTGQETSNDNFIRSADFIAFDPNISKIHLAYASDNITAKIVWYDSNYARSGASGAIDSIVPYDFDNPPAANRVYWKFALRYKAGSGLSPDATLQTLLKIQYYDAGEPGTQTDRKEEIETVLSEYGECILTKGDYYVTGVSMPVGSKIRGVGEETNLYLMASVTNGSAITPNGNNTISDMRILRKNGYSTKPSSATAGTDFGITCADNVNIIRITNCDFEGFGGAGVYGYGSSSNDCMSAFIDNCRFRYCTIGIWFYGGMEFNSVSNCICNSCYYGVENQAGNNLFTNCHFDKNTIGWYQYGIGVTPANLGHGSAVGCTFNHNTSYAVFLQGGSNGFVFSSCQLWYGEIMLRALPGILFDACEIGGVTAPITFYGSGSKGHRFNGCSFNVQPTISLQSSATTDAYIVNDCYLFDGTAVTFAV